MKRGERGFTLIELLLVIGLVALISGSASVTTIQVLTVTKSSNDHTVTIRQVQNAGHWISNDALMAANVVVDDDPQTAELEFLTFTWTDWGYDEESIYHEVTYFFEGLSDGIGTLKRTHWSSAEVNEQTTLIAEYIYYTPDVPENTDTEAEYTTPVLTLQVVASLGEATEIRKYTIWRRSEF